MREDTQAERLRYPFEGSWEQHRSMLKVLMQERELTNQGRGFACRGFSVDSDGEANGRIQSSEQRPIRRDLVGHENYSRREAVRTTTAE